MHTPRRREIDLTTYPRKGMYEIFARKLLPIVSTTNILDITTFRDKVKDSNLRFFACMSYALCKVVNEIPQFRHRIVADKLYEYERVDPGYTVLLPNNEFSFATTQYTEPFAAYYQQVIKDCEAVKFSKNEADGDNNHQFYITSNPWYCFTAFSHPYDPQNGSIPIITLGKYFEENGKTKIPVALQINHAVMDGYHMGLFYEKLQALLNNPTWL